MEQFFDAHVHIWDINESKHPFDSNFGPPPEMDAPLDQLLSLLDRFKVGRAALIQPGCYGFDANLILEVLRNEPHRFIGLGTVDPTQPDVADRLSYWIERGLIGMRVLGSWLKAPYIEALWQRAYQLQASLSFLTGPIELLPLNRLLNRLPPVVIIIDHFAHRRIGDQSHIKQLLDLARYPNVYVKVSGLYTLSAEPHPHPDAMQMIEAVFEAFGPQRLMWASDYPYIVSTCGYENCLNLFHKQLPFATPEEREWICARTADSLWPVRGSI
jgi:predicted TIM-barrel fold metal-dependent hydrolase